MIIYNRLWETMKNKNFTKYKLIHKYGIAQKTISKMTKNLPVSNGTIDKLCEILNCDVQDVMEYIPDEN